MTGRACLKNCISSMLRFLNGLGRPSHKLNLRKLHDRKEAWSDFTIREVKPDEISLLADSHVITWNETYPRVRQKPTAALREQQWKQVFNTNDGSWFCLFMTDKYDKPVGFVYGLPYDRPGILPYAGQIGKIYLLQSYTKLGLGKKLLIRAAEEFSQRSMHSIVLFASAENPTCTFYDAMGGKRLRSASGEFNGGYGWSSLEKLLKKK